MITDNCIMHIEKTAAQNGKDELPTVSIQMYHLRSFCVNRHMAQVQLFPCTSIGKKWDKMETCWLSLKYSWIPLVVHLASAAAVWLASQSLPVSAVTASNQPRRMPEHQHVKSREKRNWNTILHKAGIWLHTGTQHKHTITPTHTHTHQALTR